MQFINCTPHPICVLDQENNIILSLEPSGIIPRVKEKSKIIGEINKIQLKRVSFSSIITNLPEEEENTILIVSRMIIEAAKNRNDLVSPYDLVRDEKGKIVGCRSLSI